MMTTGEGPADSMHGVFDLHGRCAVVTGAAAGGLGAEAARVLAQLGAQLILSDHPTRLSALEQTGQRLAAAGAEVALNLCDVTDEEQVGELVAFSERGRLSPSVLVHAAGVMLRKPIEETALAEWERVLNINVTGTWLLNRGFAASFAARGEGSILNFSSVYADRVGPIPESAYYASKAAVANLTRSVASEFGRRGVRVNCLAPGLFYPTGMTSPLADNPERLQELTDRTLLGRHGDPTRDLDGPVALLASDAGRYITGQVIYVDGGWSAT